MVFKISTFSLVCFGVCWSFLTVGECLAEELVVYKARVGSSSKTYTKFVGWEGEVSTQTMIPPTGQTVTTKVTLWQVLVVRLAPVEALIGEEDLKLMRPDKKAAKDAVKECLKNDDVRTPLSSVLRQVQLAVDLNIATSPEKTRLAVADFHNALDQCLAPSTPPGFKYLLEFKREKTEMSW